MARYTDVMALRQAAQQRGRTAEEKRRYERDWLMKRLLGERALGESVAQRGLARWQTGQQRAEALLGRRHGWRTLRAQQAHERSLQEYIQEQMKERLRIQQEFEKAMREQDWERAAELAEKMRPSWYEPLLSSFAQSAGLGAILGGFSLL